ncbi:MAG TPA: hypothetical protein VFZ41_07770 [Solirubrobacterales bacterium]
MNAAGVSEGESAEELPDGDACFDRLTDEILQRVREACDGGDRWPERVRAGLSVLLAEVVAHPTMAAVVTRTFPAIGPAAYMRYTAFVSRFAALMQEGREYSGVGDELPSEVELLAVGSAESVIFHEIDAGRTGDLPEMMPEILFSILAPFIGPERAAEEMRQATAPS